MKITNVLLGILILLNLIIVFRLFTLDVTTFSITKTTEKFKEDDRKFEMSLKEIEELENVQLSENANSEDVEEYLRAIYNISRNKRGWSDKIPEIEKLSLIDSKHLPTMLEFMKIQDSHRFNHALSVAIKRNIKDRQRALLIENISTNKELIQIVIDKGWVTFAKDILFKSIKSREKYYPTEWINAVSQVADSSIYSDLKHYLVNGVNPYWTFKYIKDLPGITLENEVNHLWINKDKKGPLGGYDEVAIAKMAAIYGHKDALKILIRKLKAPEEERWGVEEVLREHMEIPEEEYDIEKWYKQNKDKVTYNKKKRIWRID